MKYKLFLKNDNTKICDSTASQVIEAKRVDIDEQGNLLFFSMKLNALERIYRANIWNAVIPVRD